MVTGMLICLRDKKLYPGLNLNDFELFDSTNWILLEDYQYNSLVSFSTNCQEQPQSNKA